MGNDWGHWGRPGHHCGIHCGMKTQGGWLMAFGLPGYLVGVEVNVLNEI